MKDRNHLAQVTTVADVNIIDNGIIDIPMLQILDENGKATPEATLPDISQAQALKIHETMAYTRVLDERMVAAQRQT